MSIAIAIGNAIGSTRGSGTAHWHDAAWGYRAPVVVPNANGEILDDFQVRIDLGAAFGFSACEADGSDLRVTDADGTTILPYWVDSFDPDALAATVWVRVPTIPVAGTTLYVYYGNPAAVPFDVPPLGPFTKFAANPIITSSTNSGKLVENIAFDEDADRYWLCYTDREVSARARVGLAWTEDFVTWTDIGVVIDLGGSVIADSPHLIRDGATWYIFFHGTNVYYATAAAPDGPYTVNPTPILTPSALTGDGDNLGWETQRVTEVYVHQRETDGVWCLWYMGDRGTAAQSCGGFTQNNQEQNGLATAPAITGPYSKDPNNPIIRFGDTNEIDSCTVADPWIVRVGDRWYQGYSAGKVGANNPWVEAVAWSDDYVTWHKVGAVLGQGSRKIALPHQFDDFNAHRGAVTRVGNTYYLTYAGLNRLGTQVYQGGIATQSAVSTAAGFPPQQVFGFYEGFGTDGVLPSHLRGDVAFGTYVGTSPVPNGNGDTAPVAGGVLGIRSGRGTPGFRPHAKVLSVQEFGPGWMVEARAQHANADGTASAASAIGFGNDNYDPVSKPFFVVGASGFGNAVQFAGCRHAIAFGNPAALQMNGQATPITVECWVKLRSNKAGLSVVLAKTSGWMLYLTGGVSEAGKINVSYNGVTTVATTSNVLSSADVGVWMHLAFTYTTDGVTGVTHIFKDGVDLAVTGTFNAAFATAASLFAGQRGTNGDFLDGQLDEVRISDSLRYTGAFTPSAAPFTSDANTVALWHLDESSGSSFADSGPHAITGTLIGRGEDTNLTTMMGAAIHAHDAATWLKASANLTGDESAMAQTVDPAYHEQRVWWRDAAEVRMQVDDSPWEAVTAHLPVGTLPVFAGVSVRNDNAVNGALNLDWLRVRRMADVEPVAVMAEPQSLAGFLAVTDGDGNAITDSLGRGVVVH